ncbi:MAG: abortive phage infection protein [Clostridiales bacterium]|nr:abortive phage infection protein [Clostridiales bacterium]
MTKAEIAKKVIDESGGIAKTAAFLAAGLCKSDIGKLVTDGIIERIRHGFYQLAGDYNITEAEYLSRLIPEGIVCVESALFHYSYTDFTPREWSIAVPRTISQTKLKTTVVPFKAYYIQRSVYELGKTQADFDGTMLPIYDKERTICDCFKYRSKLDNELFAKAVNAYANDKDKNLANLSKYAKQLRVYKKVMDMMEVLLNG